MDIVGDKCPPEMAPCHPSPDGGRGRLLLPNKFSSLCGFPHGIAISKFRVKRLEHDVSFSLKEAL
jgi:hypothetical protein